MSIPNRRPLIAGNWKMNLDRAAAVALADRVSGADLIIVARGGGSVEDLLPFSDEALVRAVHAVRTPLVSAIGVGGLIVGAISKPVIFKVSVVVVLVATMEWMLQGWSERASADVKRIALNHITALEAKAREIEAMASTLRSGHRVWLVGGLPPLQEGQSAPILPPAPRSGRRGSSRAGLAPRISASLPLRAAAS